MSLLCPATAPCDRVQHDTVEYQRVTLSAFMRRGLVPKQWKRDIKQAFRTCAIAAHHLQFASVVFMFMGTLWVSEHRAIFFGATSAVYAWHRVGHFMTHVLRASSDAQCADMWTTSPAHRGKGCLGREARCSTYIRPCGVFRLTMRSPFRILSKCGCAEWMLRCVGQTC